MPAFLAASPGVKLLGVDISNQLNTAIKGIPLVGGLLAKNKDPERMATADRLAARARQGDRAAYLELKGLVGTGPGGSGPGWATTKARDYGRAKLQEVDAAGVFDASGNTLGGSALPAPFQLPNLPTLTFTDQLPAPVKDGVAKVAAAVGTTSNTVTWIALALGVVVVVKSLRK